MKIPDHLPQSFERRDLGRWLPTVVPLGLLLIVVVIGAFTSFYTVQTEGQAVIKRWGRFVGTTGPGLHFKLPFGIDTATFVQTQRVLKQEFGFGTDRAARRTRYAPTTDENKRVSLMLSGDLNVINVEWVVQYRIDDPFKWLHMSRSPEETIRDTSEAVMRRIVGNRLGSAVLTEARAEISIAARDELQGILNTLDIGVKINAVELQDVTPPEEVKQAFNRVNEARQEKEKKINEAERDRNQRIPRAKGEAKQIVSQAQAYKTERINRARGESARFRSIYEQYKAAPEVTRKRLYLEAIDEIAPGLEGLYVIEKGASGPVPLLSIDGKTLGGGR